MGGWRIGNGGRERKDLTPYPLSPLAHCGGEGPQAEPRPMRDAVLTLPLVATGEGGWGVRGLFPYSLPADDGINSIQTVLQRSISA